MKIIVTILGFIVVSLGATMSQEVVPEYTTKVKVTKNENARHVKIKFHREHRSSTLISTNYIYINASDINNIKKVISNEIKLIKIDWVAFPGFPKRESLTVERSQESIIFKIKDEDRLDLTINAEEVKLLLIELDKYLAIK